MLVDTGYRLTTTYFTPLSVDNIIIVDEGQVVPIFLEDVHTRHLTVQWVERPEDGTYTIASVGGGSDNLVYLCGVYIQPDEHTQGREYVAGCFVNPLRESLLCVITPRRAHIQDHLSVGTRSKWISITLKYPMSSCCCPIMSFV